MNYHMHRHQLYYLRHHHHHHHHHRRRHNYWIEITWVSTVRLKLNIFAKHGSWTFSPLESWNYKKSKLDSGLFSLKVKWVFLHLLVWQIPFIFYPRDNKVLSGKVFLEIDHIPHPRLCFGLIWFPSFEAAKDKTKHVFRKQYSIPLDLDLSIIDCHPNVKESLQIL